MIENSFLFIFVSLVLSLAAVPWMRRIALRYDFVDKPGGRKQHEGAVPYGGGVVIFTVFALVSLFIPAPFESSVAYFISLALILITGVIDDKWGVNAKLKFSIHFLAAFILVMGGDTQLITLGNLLGFGDMKLGWAVIPFSVACVVYIINAVNMMDGVDGLAGGNSLIVFLWLMVACAIFGEWGVFLSLGVISAALCGFLFYNMRHPGRARASIFLGDAGSMALGVTIAWYCIHLSQVPTAVIPPVSVAWIIALPIIDAFGLLVMRLREKRHPFDPDRRHFHHHFLHAGFTAGQTAVIILGYSAILGGTGYVGIMVGIPEEILGWAWVALWLSHAVLVLKPEKFISFLSRIRGR